MQIQNTASLAGNLCNASPAADGTPNLLALDAVIELQSKGLLRRVPVGQFVLGNRQTARDNDEIVTGILVPRPERKVRSKFLKLGSRKYLVISIVMVAAVIEEDPDGRVASARVAVGSCSAAPQRLFTLESALKGLRANRLAAAVREGHLSGLNPIGDVRGTAEYRLEGALELVRRTLGEFA